MCVLSPDESVMMPLKHPHGPNGSANESLSLPPVSMLEGERVPRHTLPAGELPPDVAYQIIHDELMIDGNAGFAGIRAGLPFADAGR